MCWYKIKGFVWVWCVFWARVEETIPEAARTTQLFVSSRMNNRRQQCEACLSAAVMKRARPTVSWGKELDTRSPWCCCPEEIASLFSIFISKWGYKKYYSLKTILVCWGSLLWITKQSCMFRFCFEPCQLGSYRAYFWGGSELQLRSVCLCSWFWKQCCTRTDRSAS